MKISNHLKVVGFSWISRLIIGFTQIASIKVLSDGLGTDQYAIFVVLLSLLNWFFLADFGFGTSIQNFVSEARGRSEEYQQIIRTGILCVVAISMAVILVIWLSGDYFSHLLFSQRERLSTPEQDLAFKIACTLFTLNGVGACGYKLWYAKHKGHLSNIAPAISSLLGLTFSAIYLYAHDAPYLPAVMILFFGPQSLIAASALIFQYPRTAQNAQRVDIAHIKKIYSRSLRFWVFLLLQSLVVNIDIIILSKYANSEELVSYSIISRIFGFMSFFYVAIYSSTWPQITEAITKGDTSTVQKKLSNALATSGIIVGVATIIVATFIDQIQSILAKNIEHAIPIDYIFLVGFYQMVIVWVYGFGVYLQSSSKLRTITVWTGIQAIVGFALQLLLVPHFSYYGTTAAIITSFLLTLAWRLPLTVRNDMKLASTGTSKEGEN